MRDNIISTQIGIVIGSIMLYYVFGLTAKEVVYNYVPLSVGVILGLWVARK